MTNDDKFKIPNYKIILVGDTNVGKTSIFKKLVKNEFKEKTLSTIGIDKKEINIKINISKQGEPENIQECAIQIWDTAGQERYRAITSKYYKSAQGVIFIYDITNEQSFNNLNIWLMSIKNALGQVNQYEVILYGNKLDMVTIENKERKVDIEQAEKVCKEYGVKWGGEISAKTFSDKDILNLLENFVKLIIDKIGLHYLETKIITVEPEEKENIKKKKKKC